MLDDVYAAALRRLRPRDLEFVRAYASFQNENPGGRDRDLANVLGVTRRTIINRRKRLRDLGVLLYRFAPPGNDPAHKPMSRPRCPTCGRCRSR